ncbi:MAG: family 43 glycosylhydrolase [Bacteroidales bacterium]|nr:family 43 glycosylhydrolase [Bacteroidales bacterium]
MNIRKVFLIGVCLGSLCAAFAQNPISPMGVYIADPTSRVDRDGRLYIYGSLDLDPGTYCSDRYHVLSSADLKTWTLHPNSLKWETTIYAPDMMFKDGTYYLYYENPQGDEFVAVSDSPTGPFKDGVKIEGPKQIDPNIFIDDDGQAYYFWGQFSAKGAKMNPDMKTLDLSSMVDGIVTEKDHFFHEGSYVIKRGKYYYFIYADISRKGRPTSIGYAMATSPMGPYEYKGVIVDNAGCDPQTWNNHGSIVQFGSNWYVLYHRSTHACNSMRKACIEPIRFNEDGTIDEVEMTSQGAAGPLDAFSRTDAARACLMGGNVRIRRMEGNPSREELGCIRKGDHAVWKYLDFGKGARKVSLRVLAKDSGRIVLKADNAEGKILGSIDVPAGSSWTTVSSKIRKVKGVHALYMEFEGSLADKDILSLDWFSFVKR